MDAQFHPVVDPSPHHSTYSGTTIHHYLPVEEDGSEAASRGTEGEVAQEGPGRRFTRPIDAYPGGRVSREARDVEDVIRRHAIRRYREHVDGAGGEHRGEEGKPVWGSTGEAGGQQIVKSIPPLYKTPTKKKAQGGEKVKDVAERRKNSDGRSLQWRKEQRGVRNSRQERRKGKNTFAFFGNLFSSVSVEEVQEGERKEMGERAPGEARRPPMLVVGGGVQGGGEEHRDDEEEKGLREDGVAYDGHGLVSPLMAMSPGLSCGGLLDEKFVDAMRDVEDRDGGECSNTDFEASGGLLQSDDTLLQALSPRSLLASPRVIRKLSGVDGGHGIGRKPTGKNALQQSDEKSEKVNQDRQTDGEKPEEEAERDVTVTTKTEGNKRIDRSYDEEQVYLLMQQVKAQQAKILELEERARPKGEGPGPSLKRTSASDVVGNRAAEQEAPTPPPQEQQKQNPARPFPTPEAQDAENNALLSRMDETLNKIRADADERIRRAESQHAAKLESSSEVFEAKLKASTMAWEEERAGLLKKCAELEESNKETSLRLESVNKDKEAMDDLLESMKQKVTHLEEAAANAERRLDESARQKALMEDTSMALANQISVLTQRAQAAEKSAECAQQELQIQQAAMKTRVSTVESLNQEIQRLTRENTRLVGDKSSMEEHVRRLTSILHTVMTPTVGGGFGGAGGGLMMAQGANIMPGMATMGGPIELPEKLEIGADVTGDDKETGNDTTASIDPPRKPLAPRNAMADGTERTQKTMSTSPPEPLERMTPQEAKAYKETRTAELDRELMELNMEKEQLDQELARMPVNSGGKTVAQRRRKKLVESRLDELFRDIGKVKRELRNIKRDVIV